MDLPSYKKFGRMFNRFDTIHESDRRTEFRWWRQKYKCLSL